MLYDGDVRLTQTPEGGSISFSGGQPDMDAGLETAVYISLFTERGWSGGEIGSDFEAACRGILSNKTRLAAIEAARAGLAWLVADGIASKVEIAAEIVRPDLLALEVTVYQPERASPATMRYQIPWGGERVHLEAF